MVKGFEILLRNSFHGSKLVLSFQKVVIILGKKSVVRFILG
jgi:hypothetical protein